METPLGLTYTPSFPSMQSLFTQMAQSRVLQAKELAKRRENAETRAYAATHELLKYNPDKPYMTALRPLWDKLATEGHDIAVRVNKRLAPPEAVGEHMALLNNYINKAKAYEADTTALIKEFDSSGDYDMEVVKRIYANNTANLSSTNENGEVVWLGPDQVDSDRFNRAVVGNKTAFNRSALSEKFIKELAITDSEEKIERKGSTIYDTKTLKSRFFHEGESQTGKKTLNMGPLDGEQATEIATRFKLNRNRAKYLNVRMAEENPDFAALNEYDRGILEKATLQKIMDESGYIPVERKAAYRAEPSEADRSGNAFDPNEIGGNRKTALQYQAEVDEYKKLFSPDQNVREDALDMFRGKGVKSATYLIADSNSPTGYLRLELDRKDPAFNLLAGSAPQGGQINDNVIIVPLDQSRLKSLSAFANIVRPNDLNPTTLKKAFDRDAELNPIPPPRKSTYRGPMLDEEDFPTQKTNTQKPSGKPKIEGF